MKKSLGFTLIELLVVAAIAGVISAFMLLNFQRTRVDLNESSSVVVADLRAAQSKALASTKYDSGSGLKIRCGYGVHYVNTTSYSIYTGPDASSNNCKSLNRNFDGADATVSTKNFGNTKIEFKTTFSDIFWEPPHPYTYLNNSSASASITITIGKQGGICPQDCKTINVSTSGKIE
ncbi:MAG: type II secretion system protein [Candidatus Yanofskybacteria bacterium]|nr:type II secretion system protein [Candidatus Yanofskybacteria bacterium]